MRCCEHVWLCMCGSVCVVLIIIIVVIIIIIIFIIIIIIIYIIDLLFKKLCNTSFKNVFI